MEEPLHIDRDTGRVAHPWIGNERYNEVDIRLIDRGSEEWSFRSLAGGQVSQHLRYYEVHEFVPEQEKPFLAVAGGIAYWGVCH